MKWLDSIPDSTAMNLSKLQEIVKSRGAWSATVHGGHIESHGLATEQKTNDHHCHHNCIILSSPSPTESESHSVVSDSLEWVAVPFSRGSSQPRDLSCIAGGFFTS